MERKALLSILLCLMVALPICMTAISDGSDALDDEVNGVTIHSFDDSIRIMAGGSYEVNVTLYNNNSTTQYVSISHTSIDGEREVRISFNELGPLGAHEWEDLIFKIHVTKYADAGKYDFKFRIVSCNSDDPTVIEEKELTIGIIVDSYYASGDAYNKFFGLIPNNLPAPFGSSLFASLITLVIWIIFASLIGFVIYKAISNKWSKNNPGTSRDAKGLGKQVSFIVTLAGLTLCLRIFGADEILTGTVTDLITVAFILIGAYIAWKVYRILLYLIIVEYDKEDKIDDSLIPLFKMVGRIVVCVVALSSILSIYGFNLGTIVTSAGLVSLAISLGAQETLNQFFCGIQLMATRPFRIGDKVKLGTDQNVLIVRKIRVMDTEFKNWLNEEVFRVPNSTVMSSMITNITYTDDTYKIYEYIDVDYGADIEKAKEIMMDVVSSHPQVIMDGSKEKPVFRFSSMEASAVRLRVSYVITDHELSYVVPSQIREAIFRRFRNEGVKVPHNIVDVHVEG